MGNCFSVKVQRQFSGKGQPIFSTNGAGTIVYPYAEMNFDLHLALFRN